MSVKGRDRLHQIAEQVANCIAESGYAFVEDDKLEGLAALLGSFLTVAGIPINPLDTSDPTPSDSDLYPHRLTRTSTE